MEDVDYTFFSSGNYIRIHLQLYADTRQHSAGKIARQMLRNRIVHYIREDRQRVVNINNSLFLPFLLVKGITSSMGGLTQSNVSSGFRLFL